MGTSWQRSQISHWWVDRRQVRSHPLSPGELRFLRGRTEDTLHTHDRASEPDPRFSSGLCSEPSADHSHDTRLRPTTELRPTTLWSLRMMALGLIRDDNDLAYREEVEQLVGRWRVSSMASTWLLTSGRISPVTPHFSSTTLLWSWGGGGAPYRWPHLVYEHRHSSGCPFLPRTRRARLPPPILTTFYRSTREHLDQLQLCVAWSLQCFWVEVVRVVPIWNIAPRRCLSHC